MLLNLQAIVLAASTSSSFNAHKTKLAEKICGQEMVLYSTKLLESLNIPTTLVVGYQKELIQDIVTQHHHDNVHFVVQEEQHGTAHAILCARNSFQADNILVMHGDMPLVTKEIIEKLYAKHIETQATISFIVAHNDDPSGFSYGRVVKQGDNKIQIVEAKEFDGDLHDHCYVNAGIYIVTNDFLSNNINEIEKNDTSKQFYFTDIIKIASDLNQPITTVKASFDRIRGINNFQELWAAEQVKRAELIKHWMDRGVRFPVAQNVHIDLDVTIGAGSYIGCGAHILKGSVLGQNCFIHEFNAIEGSTLEDNVTLFSHCIVKDSHVGAHAKIGPFAHVSEHTTIKAHAVIGNFVEVKRSTIGQHSKAKHLAYLGDAIIGEHVNIGAGTITCNYDGSEKHKTIIKDGSFIGSNNTLVAPVTIEEGSYTAAGSTITVDVPQGALAIARARQINKEGYAKKMKTKNKISKADQSVSFIGAVKTNHDSKLSEGQ
ncbi:MAG: bifunctional UDP-N-acetylglucosamine diphosphorylase/glucosamine-1-phosphate N-acetyltransferase GlmU [Candidatus Dependentiae bacterium]|nr:bifunctional UDP-N-acetylglucosamine diphosphorylase/glucosamine-1-phosphate N-acetyltransferase GlmU [Candidatus Dependentiae bacterium]